MNWPLQNQQDGVIPATADTATATALAATIGARFGQVVLAPVNAASVLPAAAVDDWARRNAVAVVCAANGWTLIHAKGPWYCLSNQQEPKNLHSVFEAGDTVYYKLVPNASSSPPASSVFFSYGGSNLAATTTLASVAAVASNTFALTSAAGFSIGTRFAVVNNPSTGRIHTFEVKNISGTTITVDGEIPFPFAAGSAVTIIPAANQCRDITIDGNGAWFRPLPEGNIEGAGKPQLTGFRCKNATATNCDVWKLYYEISVPAGNATVSAYSDAAKTTKVLEGALVGNGGGEITLAAVGGSGFTNSAITIAAGATASADATNILWAYLGDGVGELIYAWDCVVSNINIEANFAHCAWSFDQGGVRNLGHRIRSYKSWWNLALEGNRHSMLSECLSDECQSWGIALMDCDQCTIRDSIVEQHGATCNYGMYIGGISGTIADTTGTTRSKIIGGSINGCPTVGLVFADGSSGNTAIGVSFVDNSIHTHFSDAGSYASGVYGHHNTMVACNWLGGAFANKCDQATSVGNRVVSGSVIDTTNVAVYVSAGEIAFFGVTCVDHDIRATNAATFGATGANARIFIGAGSRIEATSVTKTNIGVMLQAGAVATIDGLDAYFPAAHGYGIYVATGRVQVSNYYQPAGAGGINTTNAADVVVKGPNVTVVAESYFAGSTDITVDTTTTVH